MSGTYGGGNLLLDRLPPNERAAIEPSLEQMAVVSGQVLYPGELPAPLDHIYFPNGVVASMIVTMSDGTSVEAGTVGREGMVTTQAIFGNRAMLERWIGQVPGQTARMSFEAFRTHFSTQPIFRYVIERYTQSYLAALAQSIACNRLHVVVERCARWLLLSHDRAGRDSFHLTHEFLAIMLGAQRPTVSVALATLANAGFINFVRGKIFVLDRAGLESASCECYRVTTDAYERLLGDAAPDANRNAIEMR